MMDTLDAILPRLEGIGKASVALCGHTHIPRIVAAGSVLIVNPGSAGMLGYRDVAPVPHVMEAGAPHARYAIVERLVDGWTAEPRAVPYDFEAAARQAEQAGRAGQGSAAHLWHAKNRGPTRVRRQPCADRNWSKTNSLHTATDAGRKVLYEVGSPASGWASSRRCLTGYPRGASKARDDRYEVNLPVVPAGTPSARAEALSWLVRLAPCRLSATRTRCRCARWHAG